MTGNNVQPLAVDPATLLDIDLTFSHWSVSLLRFSLRPIFPCRQ